MMVSLTGCDQTQSPRPTEQGSRGIQGGKVRRGDHHFQNAEKDDPKLPTAKAFLATALSQNVVPGLTTPENLKIAQQAIDTSRKCWRKIRQT
jgi:hypothetical protein